MRPDSTFNCTAYPSLICALLFAGGIAFANNTPSGTQTIFLLVAAAAATVAACALLISRRHLVSLQPLIWSASVALFVFALGAIHQNMGRQHSADHVSRFVALSEESADAPEVTMTGRLDEFPQETVYGTRFVVRVHTIRMAGVEYPAKGRVQVSRRQPMWSFPVTYPTVEYSDHVRITGRLQALPERRNPADFDYGAYLERRGIGATMALYGAGALLIVGHKNNWKRSLVAPARSYLRQAIERVIHRDDARVVLSALVLGDRSGLDSETRTQFANTGLMHLLAVSGLHVLLVGMVFFTILKPFLSRMGLSWIHVEVIRSLLTILLLVMYMQVTGGRPSVVRAVVMAGVLIGGVLVQRQGHTLNSLGIAALILLILKPMHLFDAGFQLSFAAVGAIVTMKPVFENGVPRKVIDSSISKWALKLMIVSTAATLGTMPIVLYHFGQAPFGGILVNLIAIPTTMGILSSALLAVLTYGLWEPVGVIFGAAAETAALLLLTTAEAAEPLFSWALLKGYVRDPWILGAMVALMLTITQWPRPRHRWVLLLCAGGLVSVSTWTEVFRGSSKPSLEVVFFDVGQGDAALLKLPNGRHILVDAGVRNPFTDSADRVIIPHLERFGVRTLDAVIISHPHSDHMGGLPTLLRRIAVRRVIHNGQPFTSQLYAETMHVLDSLRIPHQNVLAGDTLLLDPQMRFKILYPVYKPETASNPNDYSVILRATYGSTTFLFAGDAEVRAETEISNYLKSVLASDVIKVGHHGSRTSSTPEFLAHAIRNSDKPVKAVVSVGRRNVHGHPSPEVIDRWLSSGTRVLKTSEGAVWLTSDGSRVSLVRWR